MMEYFCVNLPVEFNARNISKRTMVARSFYPH